MIRMAILLFILVFLVSGCNTDISEIKAEPQEYRDKQVLIAGKVVETLSIPFVNKGLYRIDDGTGEMWIISQKRAPFRGDKVTVEGIVRIGFTIGEKTYGTIVEESK